MGRIEKEKILCLSDLHCPFLDVDLFDSILKLCLDVRFSKVCLLGDIVDFYGLSKFNNSPSRADDLQYELDYVNEILCKLRQFNKHAEIIYIAGNHETRLIKYLNSRARPLRGLRCLEFSKLLGLDKYKITFSEYAYKLTPDFILTHGARCGQNPSQAILANDFIGYSGISGHAHKTDIKSRPVWGRESNVWYTLGHLSDQSQMEYATNLRWDKSFATILKKGDAVQVEVVRCNERGFYTFLTDKYYE